MLQPGQKIKSKLSGYEGEFIRYFKMKNSDGELVDMYVGKFKTYTMGYKNLTIPADLVEIL